MPFMFKLSIDVIVMSSTYIKRIDVFHLPFWQYEIIIKKTIVFDNKVVSIHEIRHFLSDVSLVLLELLEKK